MLTLVLLSALTTDAVAAKAAAKVAGTAAGSKISGTLTFEDTKAGLTVTGRIEGLPPGQHGFHVHEFGSCDEAGKAAGNHYNPRNAPHGHAVEHGPKRAHAGDFGNVTAGADGSVNVALTIKKLTVSGGRYPVAGRAVIVHEKADDFGQPLGNAGGRIACGLIGVAP